MGNQSLKEKETSKSQQKIFKQKQVNKSDQVSSSNSTYQLPQQKKSHKDVYIKKMKDYQTNLVRKGQAAYQGKRSLQTDQKQMQKQNVPVTQQYMKQFIRTFQLKKLSYNQMLQIYAKYAFQPQFQATGKAAIAMIFIPGLTNIYYTMRPNSPFAKIFPFLIPVLCVAQYIYFFNRDLSNFCFTQNPKYMKDSKQLRQKYQILYLYSYQSPKVGALIDDFRKYQKKNKEVLQKIRSENIQQSKNKNIETKENLKNTQEQLIKQASQKTKNTKKWYIF